MATLSSLQQKAINVLNDPAVKKIPSFQVGTNRISGTTLQSVDAKTAGNLMVTNG